MDALATVAETRSRPARAPLLAVEDLSITFDGLPPGFSLVDRVNLSVEPGRTLCLVGESGCGKSLVSLAIMGLLATPPARVTSGRVGFDGRDLLALDTAAMADLRGDRIAMIFQEPMTSLNPAFTIGDQIAEGVIRHRGVGRAEARARALEMLRRVKMPAAEKRLGAYPHQLSGGMRQRAMIAMALANDPKLLIADEPTTALDVTIQAQILRLVRDLQDETGTAVILVTHDLGVVAEVADTVAVMYAGRIVETGPAEAVFEDPQHPYTLGLMGSIPSLGRREGRLASIPGTVPPPEVWPEGCRFASRCPFVLDACRARRPPLAELRPGHAAACIRAPLERHVGGAA
jgi:peptide/nickel transport system ATP-binding protein